jgi:hypothetical protein
MATREVHAGWASSTATVNSCQETSTHAPWRVFLIGVRGAMAFDLLMAGGRLRRATCNKHESNHSNTRYTRYNDGELK